MSNWHGLLRLTERDSKETRLLTGTMSEGGPIVVPGRYLIASLCVCLSGVTLVFAMSVFCFMSNWHWLLRLTETRLLTGTASQGGLCIIRIRASGMDNYP